METVIRSRFCLILLALSGLARAADAEHPYACVLNFERINHPFVPVLEKKLGGMEGVRIVKSARPTDILQCLDDGAVSVMIIAHAGTLAKGQTVAPMLYFRELKGSDREDFLKHAQKQVDDETAELRNKAQSSRLPKKDQARLKDLLTTEKNIESLPADYPLYDEPRQVDGQIWRRILEQPENLKRLSIVSCMPDKVQALYPEFQEMQQEGIQVEFAPISHFMELFIGKDHVVPNFKWMKKEIKGERPPAQASDRTDKGEATAPDSTAGGGPADPAAAPAQ